MHRLVSIVVIVAVVILAGAAFAMHVLAGDGSPGGGQADVIGGDEAGLRELLSRTMASYPAYTGMESTIYVGSLPKDLRVELELPADMRVIGSVVRPAPAPTEIFLDSSQSPDDVVAFFQDSLSSDEWTLVSDFPGGGFTTTKSASAFFCSDSLETMFNVNAFGYESGSDTRIYISPIDNYACDQRGAESMTYDIYTLLPQLQTPEGVELLQGSGGGGDGMLGSQSAFTQAFLRSELPLAEITAAYDEQLEAAGWMPVDDEIGDKLAWSGWSITDDEGEIWSGTLTLTASATAPNIYAATLMIQETPDE